jgi:thioredoxin 1
MQHLDDMKEFKEATDSDKLTVIDFYAQWCGPCKRLAPKYESLATEYADTVNCYKVDVDEATDIAHECVIKVMPTFQFYKNGEIVHTFEGASENALRQAIIKFK